MIGEGSGEGLHGCVCVAVALWWPSPEEVASGTAPILSSPHQFLHISLHKVWRLPSLTAGGVVRTETWATALPDRVAVTQVCRKWGGA